MASPDLFPLSPEAALKEKYVGRDLQDPIVAGPQAVVDLALVRKSCKIMLDTVDELGVSFRAHVKTHKTTQVTRLQVGEAPRPVKLIVSTVAEAEHLLPYLTECKKKQGRSINLLYGVPPSISSVKRLSRLQQDLGAESVSFMVDHAAQLHGISESVRGWESAKQVPIFVKVDSGYSRAGVTPQSRSLEEIVRAISITDGVTLYGFYCHHGSSYGVSTSQGAIEDLTLEINTLREAAAKVKSWGLQPAGLVLSAGSTPTVTSAQNLMGDDTHRDLKALVDDTRSHYDLELHAGVYPFLDLQQLATHARPSVSSGSPTMNSSDIGVRILAEVLSVYRERETPEALIGAGTLALGREPCKSYPGWGIVAPSPWHDGSSPPPIYDEERKTGWIVGRISQEHGILTWAGPIPAAEEREEKGEHLGGLVVGTKVMVWPNHACIAASCYGWYLIVDSERGSTKTQIVDVWSRWRGW